MPPPMKADPPPAAVSCPWEHIAEDGSNLSVDLLPSVPFVRLADMFRRKVTAPYARLGGLTVPQWRVLALMDHFSPIPFGMLVSFSGSDKALVSRTVRQLEELGLAVVLPDAQGNKKKLTCAITPEGEAICRELMPIAQQRAARLLNGLTRDERVTLYTVLAKLEALIGELPALAPDEAEEDGED
jgi:DNA-binding MarR family transcriptional regulator